MSMSGQAFVAKTQGTNFTMYHVMMVLGLPLSPQQRDYQAYLEKLYPPIVNEDEGYTKNYPDEPPKYE